MAPALLGPPNVWAYDMFRAGLLGYLLAVLGFDFMYFGGPGNTCWADGITASFWATLPRMNAPTHLICNISSTLRGLGALDL